MLWGEMASVNLSESGDLLLVDRGTPGLLGRSVLWGVKLSHVL